MYDYVIVGGGIAGASLAYRIGARARTILLEGESQPGYHSTGRSAAMFMETYGTGTIRALTRASRSFFTTPPSGFCDYPLLADRGLLYLVREDQRAIKDEYVQRFEKTGASFAEVSAQEVLTRVPCIRSEGLAGAIEEPGAKDIDVHSLLQGFLRGARRDGVDFIYGACVLAATRLRHAGWCLTLSNGTELKGRVVINAAGAWAQTLATKFDATNIGLQPKRRSAFTSKPFDSRSGAFAIDDVIARWPSVAAIDESFYFKPDAGQLLASPANADPVDAHDVVPEEIDIAIGIDRIMSATTLEIRRPTRTWAGLRSFVADGDFVIGWDPRIEGFFWLAALGGYGIQTAPAASLLATNLLFDESVDASIERERVDPESVSLARFLGRAPRAAEGR